MLHVSKITAKILLLLVIFTAMLGIAGVSWIKSKPRALPGMDASLNLLISRQGWPFTVKFSAAHTHWEEWNSPLTLELQDLTVSDKKGEYSLTVPHAVVKFRVLPLLRGHLRFKNLRLANPHIVWKVAPEVAEKPEIPGLETSYASKWKIAQRNPVYLAALHAIFGILENPKVLPMRRLEATGITIDLQMPEETRTIKRDKIILDVKNGGDGPEINLSSIERHENAPSFFAVQLIKDSKDVLWAKASIENFSTDWMGQASSDLLWYGNLGLSVTGELNSFIQRSGRLDQLDFSFYSTPRSSLQFSLSGGIKNQKLYQEYTNIPDAELQVQIHDLPVDRLAAFWPLDVGVNARSWVVENLSKGKATHAVVDVKLPPSFWLTGKLPVDGLHAEVPVEHLDVRLAPDLPSITNAKGNVVFTRDTMLVTLDEGKLKNSTIQPGATAYIPNLGGEEIEQMEVKAKSTGPVSDLLSFYAVQQKKLGKPMAFDDAKVKGDADSTFTVNFPLLEELKLEDIVYTVKSNINKFEYADVAPKVSLTNGTFTMESKDKTMKVNGTGALNGIMTDITYLTSSKEGRKADADISLSSNLQAEELPKLGFPKIPGATGPIRMDYHMEEQPGGSSIVIALNAKDTSIYYPALGYAKPANEPLDVALELSGKSGQTPTLKRFEADGPGLKARGTSDFDDKGNLKELLFDILKFGKNDGQVKISRDGSRYILQIAAQTLNMEPLIRYYTSKTDDSKDDTAFTLKGTSHTVLMANGETYTGVAGELTCTAEKCVAASLSAKTANNTNLTLSLVPGEKENVFSVSSENAGAVLRGLDVLKDVRDGMLSTRAVQDAKTPDAPFKGNLIIRDFRVVGAPVLARLLSAVSLTGFVDTLNGSGIGFTKLDGSYTYGDSTYQLNDFKLYGTIGILLNGYANLRESKLKLSGTLIPAYGLNQAIGKVPIVGNLLGKGVLATSFTVEGKLDDPKTEVYPLSALAPGILSDFMRGLGILPPDKVKQPIAPTPKVAPVKKKN